MKKSAFVCFCCVVLWCGCVHGQAIPQERGSASAWEQHKGTAKQLLDKRDYAQAFEAYLQLFAYNPADRDVNLGLAWAASGMQKYTHAVLAYERLLAAEPNNVSYRLQLAHVYVFMNDKENAWKELDKASQLDASITPAIRERVLSKFDQEPSPWQFKGHLATGLMYDTNANQGPKSNRLSLGIFDGLEFENVKKVSSLANYSSLGLQAAYRLSEATPWWIVGDVGGYERWNFSSSVRSNNGFVWGRGAAGVMYSGNRVFADLRFKVEQAEQFHKDFADQAISTFGPDAAISFKVASHTRLKTRALYEKRHYTNPTASGGDYWSVGEYVQQRLLDNALEVVVGARVFGASTNEQFSSYKGWEAMARVTAKLPYDFEVAPFVSYREDYYNDPGTVLETKDRENWQWRAGGVLAWNFDQHWAVEVGYQYVDVHSNSALYTYDQHLINTGVVWKF